jgi:hypothetical protein
MKVEMEPDEIDVVEQLAEAWASFLRLPDHHPADRPEFCAAIHACQNIVMARAAVRARPDIFRQPDVTT